MLALHPIKQDLVLARPHCLNMHMTRSADKTTHVPPVSFLLIALFMLFINCNHFGITNNVYSDDAVWPVVLVAVRHTAAVLCAGHGRPAYQVFAFCRFVCFIVCCAGVLAGLWVL